ncbi:hypothetical protein M0638_27110 [Roseomonas sp. NAR14]|uniref:Uncharacterized protein n=1 Tax=Roseomonas acroporae TaxID=2937791 RepID=A0A9X1YD99_9PROT|nr:hypothetical protein [Roseomonas acroporae]MCK8788031.1 hypothetical protein [Roseomonas acroporae]
MPYLALAALLALCLVRGLWFVHGMTVPPDDDITRDLGFIQGMRDGNLFGDPAYGGEFRWYPPLLHALAALSAGLAGVSDAAFMPLWIAVGPWLGLLTPLSFFLMNQRLLGPWSAAAATAVLVLYNGAALPGDAAVSYTALTLTPMLAWPMFFFGVRLIQGRAGSARLRDALLLGSWIGLAFLAHTVPAVLLACIVTTVAFATRGIAFRTLLWLSVAALAALAWSLLFLGPLLVSYRLHIVNTVPGEWLHTLMAVPIRKWLIAANLPGIAAIAVVWWLRRYGPLSRVAVAILGSWILVCAAFLLRHYACGYAGRTGGACGVFVLVSTISRHT